jgi:hypothetical protein
MTRTPRPTLCRWRSINPSAPGSQIRRLSAQGEKIEQFAREVDEVCARLALLEQAAVNR